MKKLVAFFEIPAVDFERAVKFYETVWEVKLEVHDWEVEKMAFFSDDTCKCCGAISWAKDFKPSENGVLLSLFCENIDATLSRIETNGGKTTTPKTAIQSDGAGYFAVFTDCEGNRVGLWSQE